MYKNYKPGKIVLVGPKELYVKSLKITETVFLKENTQRHKNKKSGIMNLNVLGPQIGTPERVGHQTAHRDGPV